MVNDGKKFNILYLHNESIMGGAEISLLNLVKRLNSDLPPLFVPPLKLEFVFIQIVGA